MRVGEANKWGTGKGWLRSVMDRMNSPNALVKAHLFPWCLLSLVVAILGIIEDSLAVVLAI